MLCFQRIKGKKQKVEFIKQTQYCLALSPGQTFFSSHPGWPGLSSCLLGILSVILEAVESPSSGGNLTSTYRMLWGTGEG